MSERIKSKKEGVREMENLISRVTILLRLKAP